jgi:hypothetical protein
VFNLHLPEPMTTLQVVAVQNLVGRKHEWVRTFGYKESDPSKKLVEVALNSIDAVDLIEAGNRDKQFPQIEVPSKCIVGILNTADIDVIHIGAVGDDPSGPPRRNA